MLPEHRPEGELDGWLVERGIGETRALLIESGEVRAAKLAWPGELRAGEMHPAKLIEKAAGSRRGTALLDNGIEVLVDHLPPEATEGATISVQITRASVAERGRLKRAQARCVPEADLNNDCAQDTLSLGDHVRRLPSGLWEEVWHAASSGEIEFAGGTLLISVTPAMTVFDIDGTGSPRELALAAIPAIVQALRWFDIGGNIGIDFPTLAAKADRRAVDEALATALADWPHERTAMNGFGFVQIVARLEGPSLLHRFATSRTGMCARYAMRCAELAEGIGPVLLLTVHPAIKAKLKPEWLDELARRTGKQLRIETDPAIALEAPHAQILTHE